MEGLVKSSLEEVGEIPGIRLLFGEVIDRDLGPFLSEGNRHSAADTTVTTRDQCFPAT